MPAPTTLGPDLVPAYVALLEPDSTPEARAASCEKLLARMADGRLDGTTVFLALGKDGALRSSVRVVPLSTSEWQLMGPTVRRNDAKASDAASPLVRPAVERAKRAGARVLFTRAVEGVASTHYLLALCAVGFLDKGGRIEFKAELERLPTEDASRLTWKTMEETGRELAVETLRRGALGDSDGIEPDKSADETLTDWLDDGTLTRGAGCVHVGFLGDVPSAFVCAQVRPETGWSRITYMGLVPEARGKKLGRDVHRHGFTMMRAQGGRTYHGGTASSNQPMLALFRAAGCTLHARMSQWRLDLPSPSTQR